MNIDITALLAGDTQKLPLVAGLTGKPFGLTLEDRLAELELGLPELMGEAFPVLTPEMLVEIMPEKDAERLPDALAEMVTDELPQELSGEDIPALVTGGNPQWQLQQLVTRHTRELDEPGRHPHGKEAVTVDAARGTARASAKAGSLPTEKLPVLAATVEKPAAMAPLIAAQPVEVEVASVEMPQPTTLSVATTPAVIRPGAGVQASPVVTVAQPPDSEAWKQSVSQHIATFSRNGMHNAEIRLHPEALGSLQITLRIHQEQAQIHIVSEHAQVRQAMENAMPQLRAAMAESGVQLGQASVSADNPYGGAGTQGDRHSGRQAQGENVETPAEEEIQPALMTTAPLSRYAINTFV